MLVDWILFSSYKFRLIANDLIKFSFEKTSLDAKLKIPLAFF